MATSTLAGWEPGMDFPYVLSMGDGTMLAIHLPAVWLKPDRTGKPMLLPPAVRAIDRLRAVFIAEQRLTPGFISSLREAMGLTQEAFGKKAGVSKMTISRWECGRIKPNAAAKKRILSLQAAARRGGVVIDGGKYPSRGLKGPLAPAF